LTDFLFINTIDNENSKLLQALLYSITPLLTLLSGTHNAALFLVFLLQYHLFKSWKNCLQDKSPLPSWLLGVIMLCYCHASFFMTGHSNSIASVDLSNAYVGVEGYNVIVIGVLTFISNWSASLWWAVASWSLVTDSHEPIVEIPNKWFSFIITQSSFFSIALSSLSISVTVLREHLFIWTVFSPKYLYQVAWNCLFHCVFQVFLGTFIILFSCNPSTNQERDEIEMINLNTEE
jgi:ethanolaminephosphotransferase